MRPETLGTLTLVAVCLALAPATRADAPPPSGYSESCTRAKKEKADEYCKLVSAWYEDSWGCKTWTESAFPDAQADASAGQPDASTSQPDASTAQPDAATGSDAEPSGAPIAPNDDACSQYSSVPNQMETCCATIIAAGWEYRCQTFGASAYQAMWCRARQPGDPPPPEPGSGDGCSVLGPTATSGGIAAVLLVLVVLGWRRRA